jgi:hypothetical protein
MITRDFTIDILSRLLLEFKKQEYNFIPFKDYFENKDGKIIILRQDVDKMPERALIFAKLQNRLGIKGTYYFRIIKESFNEDIIKEIVSLGHEVGYHYEDVALAKGDYEEAYRLYLNHLSKFESIYIVKTVCMHGSPLSKWDNRDLWKKYSYKTGSVIGEPYFDLDKNKVLYLTDTGRRWDGSSVSIRDNMKSNFPCVYRATQDIINSVREKTFPQQAMITFHPQRWCNAIVDWSHELIRQKTKNIVKKVIVRRNQ